MSIKKVMQGLAVVLIFVGILSFMIGAFNWIGIVTDEWYSEYDRPAAYAWFAVTVFGPLSMAIFSSILYGFGTLIEYAEQIDGNIYSIYRDIKTMKNKIVDDCDNVSENN